MIEEVGFTIEWDNAMLRTSQSVDLPTLPQLALPLNATNICGKNKTATLAVSLAA